jgi:hypothetical protein
MTDRRRAVAELLEAEGIAFRAIEDAGADAEIVAVHTDAAEAERIAALAERIRAIGYRYVTIELDADGPA